jgi:hypothetical protein
VWFSSSRTDFPVEAGVLELKDGKVCGMLMRAGTNFRNGTLTITRLEDWETKEGVGLGSKLRKAKQVQGMGGKLVAEKRRVTTAIFGGTTDESKRKVESIRIFKKGCEVT